MKKQHYFLICGTIIFVTKEGETGQIMLNGMVVNDSRNFPVRLIGKAQQALQMLFFKQMDPETTVLDVPIQSVSYLGHMTDKEFHAPPEGMKLQEKVDVGADPFADADKPKVVDAGSTEVQ